MARAWRLRMTESTLANGASHAELGPTVLAAQIRDRADPRLVLADRVEQLYSQLPLGMFATLAIGFIAAVELREGRLIELVLFWSALLVVVVALHAVLYLGYRRDADKVAQAPQWLRWLGIGAPAATRPITGSSSRRRLAGRASRTRMPREAPEEISIAPFFSSARRCCSAAFTERKPMRSAISARVGG